MKIAPQLPDNAPFNQTQRLWMNGYLAAVFNDLLTGGEPSPPSQDKLRVAILYASQSGNSEELAENLGEKLTSGGFEAPVICADEYETIDLTTETHLIIVTSTWGEGDPPDNAVDFWKALSADDYPKLDHLQYAVLGLGDSNYIDFCGMGKKFDARLLALGASPIIPRGDCDVDYEEVADAWFSDLLGKLGSTSIDKTEANTVNGYSKKNPFPAKLLTNKELNGTESPRDTRHFEFSIEGSGLTYQVGDVMGIYPKNDPALVDEILSLLGLSGDHSLREDLISTYDIRTLNKMFLEAWHAIAPSEALAKIIESPDLADYLWGREIIDILVEFPITFSNPSDFTALLRKLSPRLYSISSSPKAHPNEVHLTIAKVSYHSHGRDRKGVCSTYLSDRVGEDDPVSIYLQSVKHFNLPTDLSTPVIMCGPGTGIAPFRAFLEERAATNASGSNWLFFGNPHKDLDFLYREQLEGFQEDGTLTRLDTAWSRDQDKKIYVQDRMIEAGDELWKWIDQGAHFYVCGDAKRMATDVDQALHQIIADHGQCDADAYVSEMKKSNRYQRDVY